MAIDLSKQFNAPSDANEFEQWFDGSKVVGPEGEPLVLFHATSHDFSVSDFYPLSHFGSAKASERIGALQRSKTFPVYLSIKNPLIVKDLGCDLPVDWLYHLQFTIKAVSYTHLTLPTKA